MSNEIDDYFDSLKGWDWFNKHYASPRPTLELLSLLALLATLFYFAL